MWDRQVEGGRDGGEEVGIRPLSKCHTGVGGASGMFQPRAGTQTRCHLLGYCVVPASSSISALSKAFMASEGPHGFCHLLDWANPTVWVLRLLRRYQWEGSAQGGQDGSKSEAKGKQCEVGGL